MTTRVCALLIVAFWAAQPAWSDLLIEPFAGYSIGKANGEGSKKDHDGTLYGVKLGHKTFGLSVGLRYNMGSISEEGGGINTDYDHTAYGLFIGYDLPILWKVSVAYYLSSQLEVATSGDPNLGSGSKIKGDGVVFRFNMGLLPFVNAFLEYQKHDYDKAELSAVKWYVLGLSIPLNL